MSAGFGRSVWCSHLGLPFYPFTLPLFPLTLLLRLQIADNDKKLADYRALLLLGGKYSQADLAPFDEYRGGPQRPSTSQGARSFRMSLTPAKDRKGSFSSISNEPNPDLNNSVRVIDRPAVTKVSPSPLRTRLSWTALSDSVSPAISKEQEDLQCRSSQQLESLGSLGSPALSQLADRSMASRESRWCSQLNSAPIDIPDYSSKRDGSQRQSRVEGSEAQLVPTEQVSAHFQEVELDRTSLDNKLAALDITSPAWLEQLNAKIARQEKESARRVADGLKEAEAMLSATTPPLGWAKKWNAQYRKVVYENIASTLCVDTVEEILAIEAPAVADFDDFTPLTDLMIDKVHDTYSHGATDQKICQVGTIELFAKDFHSLSGMQWLNDAVINALVYFWHQTLFLFIPMFFYSLVIYFMFESIC